MEDRIKVTVRFEPHLLPAMALAAPNHEAAVQRVLTPIVHGVLQQLYARAEKESKRDKSLVRRFQEALRNVKHWNETRRQLLMMMLTDDPSANGFNFVEELNLAFYTRMHVLCAANPDLGPFFTRPAGSKGGAPVAAYRVSSDCSPSGFLFAAYKAAANYFQDDPFMFVRDVSADRYIERRKRCLGKIDRLIGQVLFERVNAMVYRLRREVTYPHSSGVVGDADATVSSLLVSTSASQRRPAPTSKMREPATATSTSTSYRRRRRHDARSSEQRASTARPDPCTRSTASLVQHKQTALDFSVHRHPASSVADVASRSQHLSRDPATESTNKTAPLAGPVPQVQTPPPPPPPPSPRALSIDGDDDTNGDTDKIIRLPAAEMTPVRDDETDDDDDDIAVASVSRRNSGNGVPTTTATAAPTTFGANADDNDHDADSGETQVTIKPTILLAGATTGSKSTVDNVESHLMVSQST